MSDVVLWLILTFAGLGILLYGMSLFSNALEAVLGYRLNNKFMQVAKSPVKSYFFSAMLTFCTQKTTLVNGMIMDYVNVGTISLRQSLPMVLGLSFGNMLSAILMIFQDLNLTTYLTILCFVGAIVNLFVKTSKAQLIAKALVGFGMLFLGIELVGTYAGQIFQIDAVFNFISSINFPIVIMIVSFVFAIFTTSTFATITFIASLVGVAGAGPVGIESAVMGMLAGGVGTAVADYIYTAPGQDTDAKRVALYHLFAHFFGFVIMAPFYFTGWYTDLFHAIGDNALLTLILVHMMQMFLPILLLPFGKIMEKMLVAIMPEKKKKKDPYADFVLSDSVISVFGVGYIALLQSTKRILTMNAELQMDILTKIENKKDMRGIKGRIQGLDKAIRITNNAALRMTPKASKENMQKANTLVNIFSDLHYLLDRSRKLSEMGNDIAKKPRAITQKQSNALLKVSNELNNLIKMDCDLIDKLINNQDIGNDGLKGIMSYNKKIGSLLHKLRKEVYSDYRKNGHLPESNTYFTILRNLEDFNASLDNITVKLGILSG